ncbi:probable NADH dehydrogenase [Schistocerca gregaria]|uniref:probable NADH dehydrogenase n=1 Tax=Schistocerca gregaria TaxID=7010 RepID=UPI00211DFF61|nr:probable NADH dehydrogenase [Schistocerca gregaria]
MVSPRNHFVFTPLLASTTTGVLDFRSIVDSVRSLPNVKFYRACADAIDFERKEVSCVDWRGAKHKFEVGYDKLVIGVGADCNVFDIPGANSENIYFLKEVSDACMIREQIVRVLEWASLPGISVEERRMALHFIVVGGGPTGVEFAAELSDFFWNDIARYYPNISANDIKITLLEAGDKILPAFQANQVRKAMVNLKRQGIDMRLHSKVREVKPNRVLLDDGTQLESKLIVWSTGVGPRKLVKELNVEKSRSGRILVDDTLRLKSHRDVYALGDCAQIENMNHPPTAQVAQQQAKYLVKLLSGELEASESGKKPTGFVYRPLGLMSYIGNSNSVLESEWLKGAGWLEFVIWRSVYLSKIRSWKNRLEIPYEWLRTWIWGRDVNF